MQRKKPTIISFHPSFLEEFLEACGYSVPKEELKNIGGIGPNGPIPNDPLSLLKFLDYMKGLGECPSSEKSKLWRTRIQNGMIVEN